MVGRTPTRQFRLFIQPDDGPITPVDIDGDQVWSGKQLDGDNGETAVVRQLVANAQFKGLDLDSPVARNNLRAVLSRTGTLYNVTSDIQGFTVHIPGTIAGGSGGAGAATPPDIQRIIDGLKQQLADNAANFQRERNAFQTALRQAQSAGGAANAPNQAVQQLQQTITVLNRQVTTLTTDLATATTQLAAAQAAQVQTQQTMQATIDALTTERMREQRDHDHVANDVTAAKAMVTQLQAANSQLQAATTTAKRDNSLLKQQNETLRQECDALRARLDALTTSMAGGAPGAEYENPSQRML